MGLTSGTGRIATIDDPLRCAILISGSGSGMEAMLEHQSRADCFHTTELVISNKSGVLGIERAEKYSVPTYVIEVPSGENKIQNRLDHELSIEQKLVEYNIELVILSGYMRLLSADFVARWEQKIVNIHPSLLPDFPGAHAHRDVIAAGVDISGCTVHFVDSGMDTGEIIAQCEVAVMHNDDESSLANRIKTYEHILYPLVVDAIATGDQSSLLGN
tara:strand:+ start:902 stop:1549 length:648 start_codon:yes stop_codon:yes gene_type:complete